jgi:hypothetical protein
VSPRTDDIERRTIGSTVRCIVIGLVVLFGAYVCGRAVGILLDVNPYATEVARDRRRHCCGRLDGSAPPPLIARGVPEAATASRQKR